MGTQGGHEGAHWGHQLPWWVHEAFVVSPWCFRVVSMVPP